MLPASPTAMKEPVPNEMAFRLLAAPVLRRSQVKLSEEVRTRPGTFCVKKRPPKVWVESRFGRAAKTPFPKATALISYGVPEFTLVHCAASDELNIVP